MKHTFLILTALLLAPLTATHAVEQAPGKPNIIFILADDLSYGDLGCFGQKHIKTPNLDRLAEGGLVCNNAYAGGSWCAPSRTSLMTGLRADHWGRTPRQVLPTVADVLKGAGYRTGVVGKWHQLDNTRLPSQRGFTMTVSVPQPLAANNKGNIFFSSELMVNGKLISFPKNQDFDWEYLWKYGKKDAQQLMYDKQGNFKDKRGNTDLTYTEDVYRDAAISFIKENQDRPFFLYYATPLVHGPLAVPNLGRFKSIEQENPHWNLKRKLWAAMVEELDRSVGLLVDELKSLGLEKNTLVVFASDNGYSAWGYLFNKRYEDELFFRHKGPWDRGKFCNANGGLKVPFIMSWPGTLAPGQTDRAVGFYDFMATCAELANTTLPGPCDGISWAPLLKGHPEQIPVRAELVFPKECDGNGSGAYRTSSVLLDERWFAYTSIGNPEFKARPVRLFDITTDPGCQKDLSVERDALSKRALRVFTTN